MTSKEMFDKEVQFVAHRKGFKLVDPHVELPAAKPVREKTQATEPLSSPLRFEGKALLGKTITVHVPKRYCVEGVISRERLVDEGFCGWAERGRELYDCRLIFKPSSMDQWKIEVTE